MEIIFQIKVESLVKGDTIIRTHDVQGTGVSINECRRRALDSLAESFPMDKGHSFTGIKELKGKQQ